MSDKPDTQRLELFGGYYLQRSKDSPWGMYDPKGNWMHCGLVCTWSDRTAYQYMAALSAHIETHTQMWKRIAEDEKGMKESAVKRFGAITSELLAEMKVAVKWLEMDKENKQHRNQVDRWKDLITRAETVK